MAVNRNFIQQVAQTMRSRTKEISRALPSSKGNETQRQLQTYRTDISSYFTTPSKEAFLLYSAENWVVAKLTLETAGPVAIGTNQEIAPVLSGHGRLLDTGVEYEITLSRGTRLYIVSESINRVAVTIEPIPWLEQIDTDNVRGQEGVVQALQNVGSAIVGAVNALAGAFVATSSSGKSAAELPPCPPNRNLIPRLTGISPTPHHVSSSATPPRNVGGRGLTTSPTTRKMR